MKIYPSLWGERGSEASQLDNDAVPERKNPWIGYCESWPMTGGPNEGTDVPSCEIKWRRLAGDFRIDSWLRCHTRTGSRDGPQGGHVLQARSAS